MLILRHFLFGNFIREDTLAVSAVTAQFVGMQARYLQLALIGEAHWTTAQMLFLIAVVILCVLMIARITVRQLYAFATAAMASERLRVTLFFLPAWWLATTLPLIVAGYASRRFLYLPMFGMAVGLGSVLHTFLESPHFHRRLLATVGAIALIAIALIALLPRIEAINREATISEAIHRAVLKEAATLPDGALLVIDENSQPWGYAIPFSLQPPFTDADVTEVFPPAGLARRHAGRAW
jgi:hypothetical protein